MSEFEVFVREWEAAERSRHNRLLAQLKREYQESPRASVPAEVAIDVTDSPRLSQSVLSQQVKRRDCPKAVQPLPRSRSSVHDSV